MSIIYSYPEQGALNANDMLIGTSAEKVGGKQKNITRNFTIQQIADFINQGTGLVDPAASDFQIPVFHQQGKKITGSIMSQNTYPNGSAITITGSLTVTSGATIGDSINDIRLQSPTALIGPIKDANNALSAGNQILLSTPSGNVVWQNYEAGLTYEGTWNASTNTPTLTSGQGVSGHFYIVNVAGNTNLDGNNDWHVGDWAVFFDAGGGGTAAWQKIDNTSALTGSGTAGTFAKWTNATTLNDSIMSESGTVVTVGGSLKIQDTLEATTANTNLKLKGAGTGGVEIMSADGVTDGKITLNCSQNSHGVTIQSPAHGSGATYTLVLPINTGTAGQVLTSGGNSPSQLAWSTIVDTNTTYDLGSSTDGSNVRLNLDASAGADSFVTLVGSGIGIAQVNDTVTFTVPAGDTYDLNAGAKSGTSVPLNLTSGSGTDNSVVNLTEGTGITLTRTSATEITITGSAQGVTSVTGDSATIAATAGNTPVISAITTGGVGSTSTSLATGAQIQTAIDSALAGAVTFKGTFNANTGSITGTSDFLYNPGASTNTIPIAIGDMYIVSTAGNFYGNTALNVGDEVIAISASGINSSVEGDWNAIPSAGAGVTSILPSSTGLVSSGQPLVVTPAGGTGTVTIESTAYAGGNNVGHVPTGGSTGKYLDGAAGSWVTLPAGYTSWTASSDQNTNITVTDTTNLPFTGRLASDGAYASLTGESGIYTDTAINSGEVTIGLINNGGTPSASTFYRGDGQWAQAGGLPTKTVDTFTGSGQSFIDLTVEASSVNYIDMYIDGVYQAKATYTIATPGGTAISRLTLVSGTFPTGVSIETVTTT